MKRPHSVIIGGTKGIGRTAARMFAAEGHTLSVIARHAPTGPETPISYFCADLASPATLAEAAQAIIQKNGAISNVIFFQRFRGSGDSWEGEIATSLTGTKQIIDLTCSHFEPTGGSIVVISSVNAFFITKELPLAYHLGKAGLHQLVRYYAVSLGQYNIRVNSISPGTVIKDEAREFYQNQKELVEMYKRHTPLGRMGTAEDIARVTKFLCSEDSGFITGQDLVVDGGLSLLLQDSLVQEAATSKDVQKSSAKGK